jgi:hypothetical protein
MSCEPVDRSRIMAALNRSAAIAGSIIFTALLISGCATTSNADLDNRPFFQPEYGVETHGRKTWFDHLVELDPGGIKTQIAPDYEQKAPARIAVLPFGDHGSAQFKVNKIPLTHRKGKKLNEWAWTDANRLRRAVNGYLASREFEEANLIQVDTVLRERGIHNENELKAVPPETLGKWLGVDAVVYGHVTHYDCYYAFLVSAWQVGVDVKMVSTHDGEQLFAAQGSRDSVDFNPAFDPVDIAINSGISLLQLRDVELARAEEEDAREIALRIPRSPKLEDDLIEEAEDAGGEQASAK